MASSEGETKPDIKANLQSILSKVTAAYETADPDKRAAKMPRLLAVSKTKPKELVIEAYQEGHRDFGENYAQEFLEKSTDPEILEKCPDIRWHFIGKCQSNKIPMLAKGKHLRMVETVDSQSWVNKLQNRCASNGLSVGIMVQVNTSGEENKNGVEPADAVALAEHIRDGCPNLKVEGVMTIGALAHSVAKEHEAGANPDFLTLIECRGKIAEALEVAPMSLELSMGMSNDFEEAIRMGSTEVRVGSSIFGARKYPNKW